jgi:protein CpxP
MKKQIITLSALACLTLSGISLAMAKPDQGHKGADNGKRGGDAMRVLKQLDLSEQQKLDIKAIMQETREDNSVFDGDKQEIMLQMRDLMNMPSWDAQTARQLISAQIEQGKDIQLNRAEARHQIYSLLTNEQKAELASKADKPKNKKGKQKGKKRAAKMKSRMAKALALTDEQQAQLKSIDAEAKAVKDSFKPVMKAHREQIKALVQADVFDADAWLALQTSFMPEFVEHRVLLAESKYNKKAVLTEEQSTKMENIRNKMKDKRRS